VFRHRLPANHPTPEHAQVQHRDSLAGIPNTLPPQNLKRSVGAWPRRSKRPNRKTNSARTHYLKTGIYNTSQQNGQSQAPRSTMWSGRPRPLPLTLDFDFTSAKNPRAEPPRRPGLLATDHCSLTTAHWPLLPSHSQASRYPSHRGFLLFKSGKNLKLFTPSNAAIGSKYQTSFPSAITCAASTSISAAV